MTDEHSLLPIAVVSIGTVVPVLFGVFVVSITRRPNQKSKLQKSDLYAVIDRFRGSLHKAFAERRSREMD